MAKPIFLKNTTGSPIELTAFGVVIPAGGSREVSEIPSAFLRNDSFLEANILAGDIVINDGFQDITSANGFVDPDEPLSYIENDITFNPFIGGKERLSIPGGSTAQRPVSPLLGDIRINSDITSSPVMEIYDGTKWILLYDWDSIQTDSGTIVPDEPDDTLQIFGTGGIFVSASGSTVTIDGSAVTGSNSLVIKDEGINLPNTPHAELNFLGTGVTAVDGGSGVANITITQSTLVIKDESTTVPNTPHMTLNFIGTPVTVTDGGGGEALVTIDDPALTIKDESINVTNTPHTSLNFLGAGVSVVDAGSGVANVTIPGAPTIIFGTEFQEESDDTVSSTTSGTYQPKLNLTTGSLPNGTYRIGYHIETNCSVTSGRTECRVLLDSVTTLMEPSNEAEDIDDWVPFSGFVYQILSGVTTIDLEFNNQDAGTSSVRRARLEIWRVS